MNRADEARADNAGSEVGHHGPSFSSASMLLTWQSVARRYSAPCGRVKPPASAGEGKLVFGSHQASCDVGRAGQGYQRVIAADSCAAKSVAIALPAIAARYQVWEAEENAGKEANGRAGAINVAATCEGAGGSPINGANQRESPDKVVFIVRRMSLPPIRIRAKYVFDGL